MSAPRRVLVVDLRVPQLDRAAGDRALANILHTLVGLGLSVTFLPFDRETPPRWTTELTRAGIEVLGPEVRERHWLRTEGQTLEHVILARPRSALRYLQPVRRRTSARVLYFTHDLHHLRVGRLAAVEGDAFLAQKAERLLARETDIFRAVDGILATSEVEAATIRGLAPGVPVTALPVWQVEATDGHGAVDVPMADRHDLLFVGNYGHRPNVDAAHHLVRDVLPRIWERRPEVRALLVGSSPDATVRALASDRVSVLGHVPDLAQVYARARLTLSPLRFGAGVKGKIVESLAAGVPVVTTSVGAEGIRLTSGRDAIVADTVEELAAAAITLLDDAELAATMGAAGRTVAQGRYHPQRMVDALAQALQAPPPAAGGGTPQPAPITGTSPGTSGDPGWPGSAPAPSLASSGANRAGRRSSWRRR